MRLIDADELEKDIRKRMGGFQAERELFESINDLQPTAYDVDKVVEQLGELREEILTDTVYDNDTVNHYLGYVDLMIDTVKAGLKK